MTRDAHLAGNDERDGLDACPRDLVCASDLAVGDTERAARQEAHPALGITRLVLREGVERVRLPLVVAHITVAAYP